MGRREPGTPGDVLLVGSMPLDTVEEVFRRCCDAFGDALGCLPDGEVGDRRNWTEHLALRTFALHPDLEEVRRPRGGRIPLFPEQTVNPGDEQDLTGLLWHFRIRPGVSDLAFDDLHYADVAAESYAIFRRLKDEGTVPPHVRFQANFPGEQRDRGVLLRARRLADRQAGLRAGGAGRDRAHAGGHPG